MGLFDFLGDIAPELKDLGADLQGFKDDLVSSVVDPSGELRDAISGIATDLTGQANTIADDVSNSVQELKD